MSNAPTQLPSEAPAGFAIPEKYPRMVENQHRADLARAQDAARRLIDALTKLTAKDQNEVLQDLLARLQEGHTHA
jgi:hypothetical protein